MNAIEKPVSDAIANLLTARELRPVLVNVGASDAPPGVWEAIAAQSYYVGFDPDSRCLREITDGRFQKAVLVNEAVTAADGESKARFHLTRKPQCSSTLQPDTVGLSPYVFSNAFDVEREIDVPATTLNAVLARLNLGGVDWLKLDTQGTDLRLYQSLAQKTRDRMLVVDVEPGLIDAYVGEDLFVATHAALAGEGFWLSRMAVKGTVRMSRTALAEALKRRPELDEVSLRTGLSSAPGWCEGRYLRSLKWLADHAAVERDYLLLWAFALLEGHFGFAFEVGIEFEKRYPHDTHTPWLLAESLRFLPKAPPPSRIPKFLSAITPRPVKDIVKTVAATRANRGR